MFLYRSEPEFPNQKMSNICRLCSTKDKVLHCIFESKVGAVDLAGQVASCTTIVIAKNDEISTKICTDCLNFINEWFKFRQKCLEMDEKLKKRNDLESVKRHYECKQCPETFSLYRDLKMHKKRVHLKHWKCCQLNFESKFLYQQHVKSEHALQKPFFCNECGKSDFVSAETLRRHKLLHTGRYSCTICGKTFTCHAILRIHQRDKHENDKPFVCDVCGKAFVTELLMKYHQRFHTGEKKYICDVCGIAVATSSSLSKHKKRHNDDKPHVCDYCGKGFIVRARLIEHIRMHTGERPFTCEICAKSFTMNCKLTRHKKTHTGQKPFFCDICGNIYSTNHGLSVHRKTHPSNSIK